MPRRWPRDRSISVTALENYRRCPMSVRLQYVEKVVAPWRYNLAFNKGRAAHLILKRIADAHTYSREAIDEDEMQRMALLHLPRQNFPTEDEWRRQARDVVRGASYGRRYLDRIPKGRDHYLVVEKNQRRGWAITPGQAPYTIMARPDVVVKREDDDGAPLIEIIDYKTGKVEPQPEPPVLMRFVVRDLLERHAGRASDAHVRFTYLWLDAAERTRVDLSLEHCHDQWTGISRTLENLAGETAWQPRPSRFCRSCPYYQNACPAVIPPGEG